MPDWRLGDFAYLRRLSDVLMPRSRKVLPSRVADQDWVPVIPYNTDLDISRFFLISAQDNSQQFISGNQYSLTVGSSQSSPAYELPAGWIYTLYSCDIYIDTGVAPAAGDQVWFEVMRSCFNVKFTSQTGGPDITTNFQENVLSSRRENPPPIGLFTNSGIYRLNFPSGIYLDKNANPVSFNVSRPIEIAVPTGAEDGWTFTLNLFQIDSADVDKNWNAGAAIEVEMVWKRSPLGNYDVKGIRNVV